MATALHIDGLSTEPFNGVMEPGTSLRELVERLGGTIRTEYLPDPTPLQQKAKRAQEVGKRVSLLLREYDHWEYLPSPVHSADDNCIECDALRMLQSGCRGRSR